MFDLKKYIFQKIAACIKMVAIFNPRLGIFAQKFLATLSQNKTQPVNLKKKILQSKMFSNTSYVVCEFVSKGGIRGRESVSMDSPPNIFRFIR